jgi:hypothetical protein
MPVSRTVAAVRAGCEAVANRPCLYPECHGCNNSHAIRAALMRVEQWDAQHARTEKRGVLHEWVDVINDHTYRTSVMQIPEGHIYRTVSGDNVALVFVPDGGKR